MKPKKKSIIDYIILIFAILAITWIALHMSVSYEAVKNEPELKPFEQNDEIIYKEKFNVKAFLQDFSGEIYNTKIEWTESSFKFLAGAAAISMILFLIIKDNQKNLIQDVMYGSAEWGKLKKIKKMRAESILLKEKIKVKIIYIFFPHKKKKKLMELKEKYSESSNVIFTENIKICRFTYKLNDHTILLGGSGSKKTTSYFIPNILQSSLSKYSADLVITDPKGEILEATGYYMTNIAKYNLRVLDLKELNKSMYYNPFVYVTEDKFEEQMANVVHIIIKSKMESDENKAAEPFWDNMAELLFSACCYAVYEGFPEEERTIPTAIKLFRWFEVSDDDDRYENPTKLDDFFEVFGKDPLILQKYGDVNENPALRCWEDFRTKCKGRTAQSVTATLLEKIAPFDRKEIRRIFSKDEMELDKIGTGINGHRALYVILPPMNTGYNFIANMLYNQLFEQLDYTATVKYNQKLPVPVKLELDEFYNTGKINAFVNVLTFARSFGIGITIGIQSLEQIKELYPKAYGTILDNCSTMLMLGRLRSEDTLKYLAFLLGKGTYDKRNVSYTKGSQHSTQISYDKVGRALLDESELQKLPDDDCVLFPMGMSPYYEKKYDYTKHPNYQYTSRANSKYTYVSENYDNRLPHREEIGSKILKEKEKPISFNLDEKEVEFIMKHNLIFYDIEDETSFSVDEDSKHDIDFMMNLYSDSDNESGNTINSEILKMISVDTSLVQVVDTIKKINNEVVITGESVSVAQSSVETIDLLNDTVLEEIEEINVAADSLENDINEEFLNELQEFDINTLKSQPEDDLIIDEMNEEDEEEGDEDDDDGWVASWVDEY